jgi:hypothetical protein
MAHGLRREPDELEKELVLTCSHTLLSFLQYLAITIYLRVVSSERDFV